MIDDSEAVWVWKRGRFLLGRVDATDEGWTHKGRPIMCRLSVAPGSVALLFPRRSYWFFWGNP